MMYTAYRLCRFLATTLPLPVTYVLASVLADAHYRMSKADRDAVIGNIAIVRGTDRSDPAVIRTARLVFRNFGLYLVDFFRFSLLDESFMRKRVTVTGREHMEAAARLGKGVIVLSAHLGNWELGGSVISHLGFPLTGVALTHKDPRVNALFNAQRSAGKVGSVQVGASLKSAYAVLKRGGFLGLIGDRDFTGNGLPVALFGRAVRIPKGPAAFSCRLGSPIVPVFLIRNRDNTFTLHCEPYIMASDAASEEDTIAATTQRCVRVVEKYIGAYPEQWFAFRNIWEEYEKGDRRPHTVL